MTTPGAPATGSTASPAEAAGAIRVVVNGEPRDVADGLTLSALLTELGLGVGWVVVELNGNALIRKEIETTVLSDGDVLELIRAVAGG